MSKKKDGISLRKGFFPFYEGVLIGSSFTGEIGQIGTITRRGDYVYINIDCTEYWSGVRIETASNYKVFKAKNMPLDLVYINSGASGSSVKIALDSIIDILGTGKETGIGLYFSATNDVTLGFSPRKLCLGYEAIDITEVENE